MTTPVRNLELPAAILPALLPAVERPLRRAGGKIALITRSGGGGVARHILDLLQLQAHGPFQFHGIFTILSDSFRRRLAPFEKSGFTWDELPMRRGWGPFHDALALHALIERLQKCGAQAVHTHGTKAGYLGRLAAVRLGLRTIHTPHTFPMEIHSLERSLLQPALTLIERGLMHATDALVVLTDSQQALARAAGIGEGRRRLIHNGIAAPYSTEWVEEERARQRARLGLPDGTCEQAPVAVWAGRFDAQKNPGLLLRAGVRWLTASPRARLLLIGTGAEMPLLAAQFAQAGVGGRVVFTGEQDNVEELLCAGDLFLNASHYEGMPYVVLEAMRVGLPLILTDIPGHRDMITSGEEGFLCAPNSAAIAGAMLAVAEDSTLRARLSAASRKRAWRYRLEEFLSAHATLYTQVLNRR